MNRRGFTLVELLIVIAIIAIMASLALPRIFGPTEQSRSTEARHMLGVIRQAEEAFRNGPSGSYLNIITDPNFNGACTDAANNNGWASLGLGDPHTNPNRYFNYCVQVNNDPATPPVGFLIIADRIAPPATGRFMCLNQNGVWSGGYSQRPQNPATPSDPNAGLCGADVNLPGPCCGAAA